jgi:rare lipoprotein A
VPRDGPAPRHERDRPPPAHTIPTDVMLTPDAVPRVEPRSRYGNPASYQVFGRTYYTLDSAHGYRERGNASWYGEKFQGRRTSSGEPYDMFEMTAAHKTLPLPSYVRVTHLGNGNSVVVRVNDRGPFHDNRIIDLSYAAAARLGMIEQGQAPVEVVALTSPGEPGQAIQSVSTPVMHYLEAGSFQDPVSAVSMRESVVALGVQTVEIRVLDLGGGPQHQVLVGPFEDTEAQARTLAYLTANQIPARKVSP